MIRNRPRRYYWFTSGGYEREASEICGISIGLFHKSCQKAVILDIVRCEWQDAEEPRGEGAMNSYNGVFKKRKKKKEKKKSNLAKKTEKMSL